MFLLSKIVKDLRFEFAFVARFICKTYPKQIFVMIRNTIRKTIRANVCDYAHEFLFSINSHVSFRCDSRWKSFRCVSWHLAGEGFSPKNYFKSFELFAFEFLKEQTKFFYSTFPCSLLPLACSAGIQLPTAFERLEWLSTQGLTVNDPS